MALDFPITDTNTVRSPAHLLATLDYVFDDPFLETGDIVCRAFMWLIFMGISAEAATAVVPEDIDFGKHRVASGNREFELPDEARVDLKLSCLLKSFRPNRNSDGTRIPGDQILRPVVFRGNVPRGNVYDADIIRRRFLPLISNAFSEADKRAAGSRPDLALNLTVDRARYSGIFFRLYEQEISVGDVPDFKAYAIEEFDRRMNSPKPYQVSPRNPKSLILYRIERTMRNRYLGWKLAFKL